MYGPEVSFYGYSVGAGYDIRAAKVGGMLEVVTCRGDSVSWKSYQIQTVHKMVVR